MGWRRVGREWERESAGIERKDGWVRIAGGWEREAIAPERKGDWIREGREWVRISEVRSEGKPAKIGDFVQIRTEGRSRIGRVIDEAGDCWIVRLRGSQVKVNKCYCSRVRASRSGEVQRERREAKREAGIYGDGEI